MKTKYERADRSATGDERVELVRLLETWGGSEQRWPPAAHERITQLRGRVSNAVDLIAEARALDLALETVREPTVPISANGTRTAHDALHDALAERIVAAALSTPPLPMPTEARPSATVVRLDRASPAPQRRSRVPAPHRHVPRWQQAGALLAASLLVGILIGGNFDFEPLLQDLAGSAASTAELEATTLAFGDETAGEDAL